MILLNNRPSIKPIRRLGRVNLGPPARASSDQAVSMQDLASVDDSMIPASEEISKEAPFEDKENVWPLPLNTRKEPPAEESTVKIAVESVAVLHKSVNNEVTIIDCCK